MMAVADHQQTAGLQRQGSFDEDIFWFVQVGVGVVHGDAVHGPLVDGQVQKVALPAADA